MAQQPKDEALIFINSNYPHGIAIPASLASQVLERLEVWSKTYENGAYGYSPAGVQPEMALIPVREVIAARMLAAMQLKKE